MPIKIVMVCLGNICRSPLAEGILSSKLPKNNFIVESAGTGNWHVGNSPDKRSITIAKKYGINIAEQRATHFTSDFFENYDYIFVMDQSNYKNVIQLAENQKHIAKVHFVLESLFPNKKAEVPDPYYDEMAAFEKVFTLLDKSCTILAQKLIAKHI
jgi:protein-tyrosine phosphatase